MTLREIIGTINDQNEEAIIFAKKIGGKFSSSSEAVSIELKEQDQDSRTNEIANKYCPGFDYFLEALLVKDLIEDARSTVSYKSNDEQIEMIIRYAENDA